MNIAPKHFLRILSLFAACAAVSCAPDPGSSSGGTYSLTVAVMSEPLLAFHNIWFSLGSSSQTNAAGQPADAFGWGVLSAGNDGSGSGIVRSLADQTDMKLSQGVYYLYCMADTNNSAFSTDGTGIVRDSGDLFTALIPVNVSSNTTVTVRISDFLFKEP